MYKLYILKVKLYHQIYQACFSVKPYNKKKKSLITNLVFIKNIEDKWSKLGGIPKRKELLVDLLKTCSVQLPTWAIFDEAFVPGLNKEETEIMIIINITIVVVVVVI